MKIWAFSVAVFFVGVTAAVGAGTKSESFKPYSEGKVEKNETPFKLQGAPTKGESKVKPAAATRGLVTGHPYVVFLDNMSNWTATHVKDQAGGYSEIRPPIGKTCERHDPNWCFENKRYAPMLTTDCSSAAFAVALRVTHPSGVYGDTTDVTIHPNCGYSGEVIHMDLPDPK